jgi:hypothetical protein
MASYRIYYLEGDGSIGLADWVEAKTEEEAIVEARKLRPDAHRCEIWHKRRLVAKLNSDGAFERIETSGLASHERGRSAELRL